MYCLHIRGATALHESPPKVEPPDSAVVSWDCEWGRSCCEGVGENLLRGPSHPRGSSIVPVRGNKFVANSPSHGKRIVLTMSSLVIVEEA